MFELISVIVFCWLFYHALRLMLRITWGAAKVIAVILLALALPSLLGCLLLAGGAVLLLPLALMAAAWGILKACV